MPSINSPFHVGHVVVETGGVLRRGTVAKITSKALLGSLTENVG